ncbi:MAG: DUF4421 family protein [Flavitalea sp.]
MIRLRYTGLCWLVLIVGTIQKLHAQQFDTTYISQFEKKNVVELYPGIYGTSFDFKDRTDRRKDFRLVANSAAFVGGYINYKWLSAKYAVYIPGTSLARNEKLRFTSFRFRYSTRHMMFHPFYDSYKGLLAAEGTNKRRFEAVRNVSIADAGLDYYYFFNTKRYSFHSAMFFSEKQVKSAGSLFLMATPMWQRASWKFGAAPVMPDTMTIQLLTRNPSWLTLIGRVGYGYNFSFDQGKWMVAPTFMAGGGALREIKSDDHRLRPVTDVEATLNAGYNGSRYYVFVAGIWSHQHSDLRLKDMQKRDSELTLTFGYRFDKLK